MAWFTVNFTWIIAISSLLLSYYFLTAIRSYRRLSHIPGPKPWALSILPVFYLHLTGETAVRFGEFNDEYGPLVRLGPNFLLSGDAEIHRRMGAPRSLYTRANWYLAGRITPGVDNVLSTLDEDRHTSLRRKMTAAYSGKENENLEQDIDQCVLDLCRLIETKYISTGSKTVRMELARKIQYLTSDVMSKLSFDAKFHDLRDDNDNHKYIHEIETLYPNIFCTCMIPEFLDFLTRIGLLQILSPISETSKFGLGRILAITKQQVAKRFDADGKLKYDRKDMLGSFIRHGLTREELEQESVLQLAAGSDTSATAIRATMLCIMRSPDTYRKLMAEIDGAMKSGTISSGADNVISDAQAKELTYLQAVIKEGLRWFPPIAGGIAKKVPKGGDTISGYFIPEGTSIGYCANAIHHNADLFAPDPLTFRPERWIHTSQGGDEPSLDKIPAMERNNDIVFGYGKYQCLGKPVALIELNKIFVELLRRFEFTLLDPENPWSTKSYGVHFQRGLWVSVRRRVMGKRNLGRQHE